MTRKGLVERLLRPSSIAVVGASDNPTRIGGRPISYLLNRGFPGPVYGVNPNYREVQGRPCFPSFAELPKVDLAIFAVAAERAMEHFEAACRTGIKAAVIFSGGFAEVGLEGAERQRRLSNLAEEYGVALCGPNCVGIASLPNCTYATFMSSLAVLPEYPPGHVALLSQSGGFVSNVYTDSVGGGARFSHMISTGNEAGVTFCDYLEYLLEDSQTKTVLGYIEGIRDGQRFCDLAGKFQRAGKPLAFIKAGVSPQGVKTAQSHTGQLSGEDASFQAAFDRYGVIRLRTMTDLVDCARVFSTPPIQGGVSVATISGGAAVQIADHCAELGVPLTVLSPTTEQKLREVLPEFGRATNPVDVTAQVTNDVPLLSQCIAILDEEDGAGLTLIFIGGQEDQSRIFIPALIEIQQRASKPLVLVWAGVTEEARTSAAEAGLMVFADPYRALKAIATCYPAPNAFASAEIPDRGSNNPYVLNEWTGLQLLRDAGIDTPPCWRIASLEQIHGISETVSYPCVMKLLEPVIAHRSKVGAVILGIDTPAALTRAWETLVVQHLAKVVLVAEQVPGDLELLVGALTDQVFGQRVVVGAGGVLSNDLDDYVTLIPPLTAEYVRNALTKLRLWPVLRGGYGLAGAPIDQLVQTIQRMAAVHWKERDRLAELECNPIIVSPTQVIAVDALAISHDMKENETEYGKT